MATVDSHQHSRACWRAWRTHALALALAALLGSGSAGACSIPVFRYALERWPAAPYDIVVFHQGPLSEADQAALRRLQGSVPPANLRVTEVDLALKLDPGTQQLWRNCSAGAQLPWVAVRWPEADTNTRPLFAGPLTEATVETVLDSPTRRQLVQRLAGGDSVVFVLLTGDNRTEDEAAARLLERELPHLHRGTPLPEPSEDGPQLLSRLPLKATFTFLRLSRHDPQEQVLIRTLLHSGEDLEEVQGPIVFPVFGRGRVLDGLHGRKLTAAQLEQEASFLAAACSCRVKELNPGLDLLLAADWNTLLGIEPPAPAPSTILELPTEMAGEMTSGPEVPAVVVTSPTAPPRWLRVALAGAAGLVVGTGIWAWRSRSPRV